jgi:peptidoglycan/LPS O-acetylase OafA/YrhL
MASRFGTRSGPTSTPPRLDIQGMRALAVGLVIAGHAGAPGLTGGFVGVDVFFVVSGYLITMLLLREALAQGRVRLLAFYARRARRILPAATVVLVAVTVYAAVELSVVRGQRVVDDVLWSAFFSANIHFSALGTEYGAEGQATSPVQHYWSLSVEEQFYLVWPIVLAVILGVMLRGGRGAARTRSLVTLACLTAAIWTVSLSWAVVSTHQNPAAAYFATPLRAWELATGALLAIATTSATRVPRWLQWLLVPGGLVLISAAATTYTESTAFPGLPALLPVLGTAAVLGAGAGQAPSGPSRLLTLQPLPWLGNLSYSLYLWHWPVLTLGAPADGEPTASRRIVLVLCVLGLSVASYYLVENPIRRARLIARSWRGLALWPVALGAVVVGTSTVSASADRLGTVREHQAAEYQRQRVAKPPLLRPTIGYRIDRAIAEAQAGAPIPHPLVHQDQLGNDLWHYVFTCSSLPGTATHRLCPVGDTQRRRGIAVYGDSHAGMWLPALASLGTSHGYRVTPFVKYGCSPYHAPLGDPNGSECARYHAWALGELQRMDPEVIVVSSRLGVETLPDDSDLTWGSETLLGHLAAIAPVVRVLADVSSLPFDPADCVTAPESTLVTCLAPELAKVVASNALLRAVAGRSGTGFVDTAALVCRQRLCPVVVGDIVTFGDYDHISVTWARRITRELGERLSLPRSQAGRPGPRPTNAGPCTHALRCGGS